jgi:putative FmdB family regulatory protein
VPIYEYECQNCGHRVELIQQRSDAPLAECPKCHGAVKKLLAAPALQFKGSGWYITDYSNKGKEKPDGKPAETSDTKPAGDSAAPAPAATSEKKADSGGSAAPSSNKSDGTGKS